MNPDPRPAYKPSWRKPAGMFMILGLIGRLPIVVQVPVYVFLGLVWIWILPLKRLLAWMETGRWRGF